MEIFPIFLGLYQVESTTYIDHLRNWDMLACHVTEWFGDMFEFPEFLRFLRYVLWDEPLKEPRIRIG